MNANELAHSVAHCIDTTAPGEVLWDEVQHFAPDHPAVVDAQRTIEAAHLTALRGVARDLEGLVAAHIDRCEAERCVSWLAATLRLAGVGPAVWNQEQIDRHIRGDQ